MLLLNLINKQVSQSIDNRQFQKMYRKGALRRLLLAHLALNDASRRRAATGRHAWRSRSTHRRRQRV